MNPGILGGLLAGAADDTARIVSKQAIQKSASLNFKDELEKLRKQAFDIFDNGEDYFPEDNQAFEDTVQRLANDRGFSIGYDENWGGHMVDIMDNNMDIRTAAKNMQRLAKEYGFNIEVNPDNTLKMYHGTDTDAYKSILSGGFDDGITYFSPSKEIEYGGVNGAGYYGNNIVTASIDPRHTTFNPSGEFFVDWVRSSNRPDPIRAWS